MNSVKDLMKNHRVENPEQGSPAWSLDMLQSAASQTLNETECLLSMDCLDGVNGWEINSDGILMHGKIY